MHALLLVPDGVGVRNFVLGAFLRQLADVSDATVLHTIPEDLLSSYTESTNGQLRWQPLQIYTETPVSSTLRYALAYAHMYWGGTRSMRFNLRSPVKGSWRTRALHTTARVVGRVAARPAGIKLLERAHADAVRRMPAVAEYHAAFERLQPTVLFCTHQRPLGILPAVLAAKQLGIPTATFIFSWDNLSSKGRIAVPFDHYFVWSALMRDELLHYYPDVRAEQIHIVGTPQFDPYADPLVVWSREEFCTRVGADSRRRLVCYSGGDNTNSPEDPAHVRILMEAARAGRLVGAPQVLLRPSPADDGRRYDSVRRDYPELIYSPPAWVHPEISRWDYALPKAADIQLLTNLTAHTDVNVNLGSTMTLDFAIRDKPVVNVAFDVASPPPFGVPLWDHHYQFEHYQAVIKLGAARFARSSEELVTHVNAYLVDPSLDREGRRRLVEMQVGRDVGTSSRWIVKALEEISAA